MIVFTIILIICDDNGMKTRCMLGVHFNYNKEKVYIHRAGATGTATTAMGPVPLLDYGVKKLKCH